MSCQYPRNEAAHTAARKLLCGGDAGVARFGRRAHALIRLKRHALATGTIRRSLEKWGDTLDLVAIVPDQTASVGDSTCVDRHVWLAATCTVGFEL